MMLARLTISVVRSKFQVEEIDHQPEAVRDQKALFYATVMPLKILLIEKGSAA